MALPDTAAVWRAWLTTTSNPLLQKVTAANVRWTQLNGFSNTTSAIVINRQSGQPDPYRDKDIAVIAHRCYGGSQWPGDAMGVANALMARVRAGNYNQSVTGGGVIEYATVLGYSDSHDRDLDQCPVVVVLVEVNIRN